MKSLNDNLRSLVKAAGYEVRKTSVYSSQNLRHRLLFSQLHIDLVLDVGANIGQFARHCRAVGYQGRIISFEPSVAAHATLLQSAASDPLWDIADRMALGSVAGKAEINIAANSLSSSILPMLDTHLSAAPDSHYLRREVVPVRRLDDVLAPADSTRRIFLKLDVQGYEPQVLAGAARILTQTLAVQLEMSLVPLYQGEVLMPEICARMKDTGLQLWDLEPSFRNPTTGRLLQVDGIFTRPSLDNP